MSAWKSVKDAVRNGDGLTRLLIANSAIFLIIQFYLLFCKFSNSSLPLTTGDDLFLASTSDIHRLMLRPWSIITHMFTHTEFGHFFFNMIFLYSAGKLFQQIADSRKLIVVYLLGGLSGFMLYFIFYNVFPALEKNSLILGASASAMAVVIAIATLRPSMVIKLLGVFDVKLVWLAAIFVVIDLWSLKKGENIGGHIGHLGGAIFGYFYAAQLKQGKPVAVWLEKFLDRLRKLFHPKPLMVVKQKNPRFKADEEFNEEKNNRQKRVDEILDKIGRSGYDSLSREEREFLFKYSQK
ncbi:MAG: rhomboid family intramembrane serine protease [Crocinitomicaceae bacterium]|nr:rhomboid family intramembrane serine protease [Crocinitomicaceae bacterium]